MPLPRKIVIRSYARRPGELIETVTEQQKTIDLAPRSAIRNPAGICCKTLVIETDDYVLREPSGEEFFRGGRAGAINQMYDIGYDLDIRDCADFARNEGIVKEVQLDFEDISGRGRRLGMRTR